MLERSSIFFNSSSDFFRKDIEDGFIFNKSLLTLNESFLTAVEFVKLMFSAESNFKDVSWNRLSSLHVNNVTALSKFILRL